jgi:mandelate racemase
MMNRGCEARKLAEPLVLLDLTPTCHRLEYLDHAGPILTQPIEIRNGLAYPPERPGNGLDWNEPLLRRLFDRT